MTGPRARGSARDIAGLMRTTQGAATRSHPNRDFVANSEAEHERRLVLAARLREALKGISFTEIGRRTGWSTETVRRYLRGKASPPATLLMVLVDEFSVNPEYLLLGRGPAFLGQTLNETRPVSNRQLVDALHFLIAQQKDPPRSSPGHRQSA